MRQLRNRRNQVFLASALWPILQSSGPVLHGDRDSPELEYPTLLAS